MEGEPESQTASSLLTKEANGRAVLLLKLHGSDILPELSIGSILIKSVTSN